MCKDNARRRKVRNALTSPVSRLHEVSPQVCVCDYLSVGHDRKAGEQPETGYVGEHSPLGTKSREKMLALEKG